MKTAEQYEKSLRELKFKVYLQGELVSNIVDHPIIRPSLNSVKATYELAEKPEYEDLMTATSHLTGKKINRFCHLHQNTDDLVKKVKMQRLLGQKTSACFQRCVGMDAINAVDSVTFEMDQKLNTQYHERLSNSCSNARGRLDGRRRNDRPQRRPGYRPANSPTGYVRSCRGKERTGLLFAAPKSPNRRLNSHWILSCQLLQWERRCRLCVFCAPADAEGIFYIYGRSPAIPASSKWYIDVGNRVRRHEALMVFDTCSYPGKMC